MVLNLIYLNNSTFLVPQTITKYYNNLAKDYDNNRFANTYGKYIHTQEDKILQYYLKENNTKFNLDIACGTGRFLKYADFGADISSEMIKISQNKYPDKTLKVAKAECLPFNNMQFENITCFHLMMHLNNRTLSTILTEAHRVLKPVGRFIFDVPSEKRRKLTKYKSSSWHGGHQISVKELKRIINNKWHLETYYGIAFLPIHRIPKSLRKRFVKLDNSLSKSILKEYSSHLLFILTKK